MEKISESLVELDSLKQGKQEKKIGPVGICPKCDTDMEWRICRWVCLACEEEEREKRKVAHAHERLALPPRLLRHSFENYKTNCTGEHKAKQKCLNYADNYNGSGGLIMVGGVGTGKTHLAVAMCKYVCDQGNSAHLTTVPRIIREVRASWGKAGRSTDADTEAEVIARYAGFYQFLVIDEIGSQYGSDSEKIIISEIINDRYNNNLPTVIIGNVTIEQAEEYLGVRVIDRLKDGGSIIVFDWKSHRKIK